ncbi:DUF4358 domain-containing protein [Sporosalibacterium faouarense]|uniref:DUF4358 domain-containing protein n=1 Tax=Sporosalibacterium faouarense TaxID=516123 RepID=UPI00141C1CA7|nr:DUF4358 domain-containing protein [Sporosalibacterium faouarense]MTI47742.1 DUF4358 domain-containing protein [Bacillota bacterium]
MKKIISVILILLAVISFAGCSQQTSEVNIPVKDIIGTIQDKMIEDAIANGLDEEAIEDGKLPGYMEVDLMEESDNVVLGDFIKKEDIEEGIALQSMFNVNSDLIIVLKAKTETEVDALKGKLEEIKEMQDNTWSSYLPDQYEKVKNNIIEVNGRYLIYITSQEPESIKEIFDSSLEQ